MNRRSRIFLSIAVPMTALWAASVHASETPTPLPSPGEEVPDTVISSATRSMIETFGDLSRTASKLSETALKLLEAQDEIDRRRGENTTTTTKKIRKGHANEKTFEKEEEEQYTGPRVYLGEPEETEENETPDDGLYERPRVYIDDARERTDSDNDTIPTLTSIWAIQPEELNNGRYVWVPDGQELTPNIRKNTEPDLSELTYWRGDSIPMAIPTKRYGRYDRKLYNWLIYPKGQVHISLSANYGELTTEDSEILSLLEDIDVGGKIYSIKPSVSYFFKSNLCAGVRLAFTKGELSIDNFMVDIDEDINFNLHDVKYSSDSYSAAIFLQQHFGLARRSRFSVYNEVELAYGMGNKHFIRPFDGEMKDTRTKTQSFNINYSPGVSIMMMKNAAFNLSFGIFGFHLQDEKQWENGEECGSRFTSGINFRFNIFNINFGVSIII